MLSAEKFCGFGVKIRVHDNSVSCLSTTFGLQVWAPVGLFFVFFFAYAVVFAVS